MPICESRPTRPTPFILGLNPLEDNVHRHGHSDCRNQPNNIAGGTHYRDYGMNGR